MTARGADVVGIDPTESMLDAARGLSPDLDFRAMSATEINFPPDSFDVVVAVTVIQHLKPDEQEAAAAAMCRVLRPGGTLFVLELIDQNDPGRQVFPRTPHDWVELYWRHGLELDRWEGQEFVPLIRSLMAVIPRGSAPPADEVTAPSFLERLGKRGLPFLLLWPVIQLSLPLEYACERLAPRERARHGCFLLAACRGRRSRSSRRLKMQISEHLHCPGRKGKLGSVQRQNLIGAVEGVRAEWILKRTPRSVMRTLLIQEERIE